MAEVDHGDPHVVEQPEELFRLARQDENDDDGVHVPAVQVPDQWLEVAPVVQQQHRLQGPLKEERRRAGQRFADERAHEPPELAVGRQQGHRSRRNLAESPGGSIGSVAERPRGPPRPCGHVRVHRRPTRQHARRSRAGHVGEAGDVDKGWTRGRGAVHATIVSLPDMTDAAAVHQVAAPKTRRAQTPPRGRVQTLE